MLHGEGADIVLVALTPVAVGFLRALRIRPHAARHLAQTPARAVCLRQGLGVHDDDELPVDEMAMFEQRLGTASVAEPKEIHCSALKVPPPSRSACKSSVRSRSPEARDSVLMAAADGNVDEDGLKR